jgi:hypothetical protein
MGTMGVPRTVAAIHIQAGARLYVMGHMGTRAGLPITPMIGMGMMGTPMKG